MGGQQNIEGVAKPAGKIIDSGSLSKSVGVQAKPKHNPFRMSSDFPYQWKDLEKDNADKRDNKTKDNEAVREKTVDRKAVSKASLVRCANTSNAIEVLAAGSGERKTSALESGWTEVKGKKNLNSSSSKISSSPKKMVDSEDFDGNDCERNLKVLVL